MTTLNPLGDKPVFVNVFYTYAPQRRNYGFGMPSRYSAEASVKFGPKPLYRLKVTPWIPHDGGPCPVALDQEVNIRVRCGDVRRGYQAGEWVHLEDWWRHVGEPEDNIIAYQIVE